jgi:hypothetical protein
MMRNAFCTTIYISINTEVIMKLLKFLAVTLVSGLAIASCKSPVYVQKDESVNLKNYHTYAWVETKANDHDGSQRATAMQT